MIKLVLAICLCFPVSANAMHIIIDGNDVTDISKNDVVFPTLQQADACEIHIKDGKLDLIKYCSIVGPVDTK